MARPHVLWVLVAATARAKRSNPPQKPLVARTYTTATVDALGAEAAADVRVAFDGGCRTLAGDECAGPTRHAEGFEPVTGPASIAASLTASGDSLKRLLAAPSTPAAAIQSLQRCAGDTTYGIAGAAGAAGATRCRLRFPSMARIAWSAALTASLGPPPPFDGGGAYV